MIFLRISVNAKLEIKIDLPLFTASTCVSIGSCCFCFASRLPCAADTRENEKRRQKRRKKRTEELVGRISFLAGPRWMERKSPMHASSNTAPNTFVRQENLSRESNESSPPFDNRKFTADAQFFASFPLSFGTSEPNTNFSETTLNRWTLTRASVRGTKHRKITKGTSEATQRAKYNLN